MPHNFRQKSLMLFIVFILATALTIGGWDKAISKNLPNSPLLAQGQTATRDKAQIRRLFEQVYADKVRAGDKDSYATMFTQDALWMPPGHADQRGKNAIAAAFGEQANAISIEPNLKAEEIEVMGNFAYVVGTSVAGITPKDGSQPSQVKLRIVWLLQKDRGTWKIAREIWNAKPSVT